MPNLPLKWAVEVKKQQTKKGELYTPVVGRWTGLLGRNDGVVQDPDYPPGYVFVRDNDGILLTMWNQRVPNTADLPVWYGYDVQEPKVLQVLSQWTTYATQPQLSIPSHHATHEWPAPDTVWVNGNQILPWVVRPTPNTNFSIDIFPGLDRVSTTWVFKGSTTIDLTSHVPATGACFVVVCMDDTGAYTVVDGTPVATPELLTGADIPNETAGTIVKAIVRLYNGQGLIQQNANYTDIFDDRFAVGLGGGGGGSPTGAAGGDLTGTYPNPQVNPGTGFLLMGG